MIADGVNFNADAIRKMTREEFEKRHIGLLWLDRDETTRSKMLGAVYDRIAGKEKKAGR